VAFDHAVFGDRFESFGELALRGQMFVATSQLARLAHALASVPGGVERHLKRKLFAGRFRDTFEVRAFVRLEFERANGLWLPYRKIAQEPGPPYVPNHAEEERARRYHHGLSSAEVTLHAILPEPSVESMLRSGSASMNPVEVRSACSLFTVALQLRLAATRIDLNDVARWSPSTHPERANNDARERT
jgi:hypothetical protein